jgi:4'-phosphopantetheinyl transferase
MKILELRSGTLEQHSQCSILIYQNEDSFSIAPQNYLSAEELIKANSLSNPKRRKQYLESRYYLKEELGKLTNSDPREIDFLYIGEGKPILKSNPLNIDFNLSHTENMFAMGFVKNYEIGIDIEPIKNRSQIKKVAERVLTPRELNQFQSFKEPHDQLIAFTKIWSTKEAIVKVAAGSILRHSPEIEINLESWTINKLPTEFGELSRWQTYTIDEIEGYCISYALRQK